MKPWKPMPSECPPQFWIVAPHSECKTSFMPGVTPEEAERRKKLAMSRERQLEFARQSREGRKRELHNSTDSWREGKGRS